MLHVAQKKRIVNSEHQCVQSFYSSNTGVKWGFLLVFCSRIFCLVTKQGHWESTSSATTNNHLGLWVYISPPHPCSHSAV